MMNNKKGDIMLAFSFAFFFFLIGMLMLPFIEDTITSARENLDCTNSSISDGNKISCLYTDVAVPYFIVGILVLVGGFIGNELR